MTDLLELTFAAKTATEAEQMARDWAAAEPAIRLERITRVRPTVSKLDHPRSDYQWLVEIAYSAVSEDQQTLGLT